MVVCPDLAFRAVLFSQPVWHDLIGEDLLISFLSIVMQTVYQRTPTPRTTVFCALFGHFYRYLIQGNNSKPRASFLLVDVFAF